MIILYVFGYLNLLEEIKFSAITAKHYLCGGGDLGARFLLEEYDRQMQADITYRLPLHLHSDGISYWLAADYSLYLAYEILGLETVLGKITQGTEMSAILESVTAFANPVPRSILNRKVSIQRLLQSPFFSDWDDLGIAQATESELRLVVAVRTSQAATLPRNCFT